MWGRSGQNAEGRDWNVPPSWWRCPVVVDVSRPPCGKLSVRSLSAPFHLPRNFIFKTFKLTTFL